MSYSLVRKEDASPRTLLGKKAKRPKKKPRARVALRLNLDLVLALDAFVEKCVEDGERVTRTSVIQSAVKLFLKGQGAF